MEEEKKGAGGADGGITIFRGKGEREAMQICNAPPPVSVVLVKWGWGWGVRVCRGGSVGCCRTSAFGKSTTRLACPDPSLILPYQLNNTSFSPAEVQKVDAETREAVRAYMASGGEWLAEQMMSASTSGEGSRRGSSRSRGRGGSGEDGSRFRSRRLMIPDDVEGLRKSVSGHAVRGLCRAFAVLTFQGSHGWLAYPARKGGRRLRPPLKRSGKAALRGAARVTSFFKAWGSPPGSPLLLQGPGSDCQCPPTK